MGNRVVFVALLSTACAGPKYRDRKPEPLPVVQPDDEATIGVHFAPLGPLDFVSTKGRTFLYRLALGWSHAGVGSLTCDEVGAVRTEHALSSNEDEALACQWRQMTYGDARPECETTFDVRSVVQEVLQDLQQHGARAGGDAVTHVRCFSEEALLWCEGEVARCDPQTASRLERDTNWAMLMAHSELKPTRWTLGASAGTGWLAGSMVIVPTITARARYLSLHLEPLFERALRFLGVGVNILGHVPLTQRGNFAAVAGVGTHMLFGRDSFFNESPVGTVRPQAGIWWELPVDIPAVVPFVTVQAGYSFSFPNGPVQGFSAQLQVGLTTPLVRP